MGHILEVFSLGFGAFALSYALNASFEGTSRDIALGVGVPAVLSVIALGIFSDGLGIASARAKQPPLLAMASRRVTGAKEALWFVRNASRVSSVFSDVLGDVAATIAGALALAIGFRVQADHPGISRYASGGVLVGLASGLMVGGKALFKPIALKYAEVIILSLGKVRYHIGRVLGRTKKQR